MASPKPAMELPVDRPVPSLMHRTGLGGSIRYVRLDVHKDRIVVAVAAGGLRGDVRE